jgi:dolichyldiphosphatase
MFLGQLACEAVNFALKRLIKEERPRHLHAGARGYGMPSSHAQFVVFWAVAVTLFLLVRHRPLLRQQQQRRRKDGSEGGDRKEKEEGGVPSLTDVSRAYRAGGLPAATASIEAYSHAPWNVSQRVLVSAAALVVAALVSWSRVYLGYHTVRQVQAGCAAGAVCGVAWFAVTYLLRETGMLAWALEMPLARWFRVRDLVVVEDLCLGGWETWVVRWWVGLERLRQKEAVKGTGGKGE